MKRLLLLVPLLLLFSQSAPAAGAHGPEPAYPETGQVSHFPRPLADYDDPEGGSIVEVIVARAKADPFNVAATLIFFLAICHTFAAGSITQLAHKCEHAHQERIRREGRTARHKDHEGAVDDVCFKASMLHFLGEVEAIFGIWVIALGVAGVSFYSWEDFKNYISYDREFIEPAFVVVIMAIAASRPVLRFSEAVMAQGAKLGNGSPAAWWLSVLTIAPVLGSFITEPAAMTIGALLLLKKFYRRKPGKTFAYATLGLLFVNVSVGGTLTHFAAPPVLMVAGTWGWGMDFMLLHFGWKAVIGVVASNFLYYLVFRKQLERMADLADGTEDGVVHPIAWQDREDRVPAWIVGTHLAFLAWTVFNAHAPIMFIAGFLFFMAFVIATQHHQNQIRMRGPILVGFFLGALIVHGGCQSWWIEPVIQGLGPAALKFGATVLTAFNDNAAITYLAAQVPNIDEARQYAVVAGAVTGGGLTVIANAPNPAGQSILAKAFGGIISPLYLALGALVPTAIVYLCFSFLPNLGGTAHPMRPEAHAGGHPAAPVEAPAAPGTAAH